jgi:hypothetical protein
VTVHPRRYPVSFAEPMDVRGLGTAAMVLLGVVAVAETLVLVCRLAGPGRRHR